MVYCINKIRRRADCCFARLLDYDKALTVGYLAGCSVGCSDDSS